MVGRGAGYTVDGWTELDTEYGIVPFAIIHATEKKTKNGANVWNVDSLRMDF